MSVLDRVKEQAKAKGLSIKKVEEKANLSNGSIYKWKTVQPKIDNVKKVADVLGVSVSYLLGETDEPYIFGNINTENGVERGDVNGATNALRAQQSHKEPKGVDNSIEGIKARLVSYDGTPVTDHDAKVIKQFLDAYYAGKDE